MNEQHFQPPAEAPEPQTSEPQVPQPQAEAIPAPAANPAPAHAGETAQASVPEPAARPEPWPNGNEQWQRVSPSYVWVDLALNLLWTIGAIVALVLSLVLADEPVPLPVVIGLSVVAVVSFVAALLAFRHVRAIGYILREDDLLFRRGIIFERVIAVPYGRLQLVDVTRGPLLRALGLATLKFVTASAATGVNLPGLRLEDAEALRDRLVELAETRRSGL